jgi:hypothetical protein
VTNTTKQPTQTIAYRIPGVPQRAAVFAPNPYLGPHWQEPEAPEPETDSAPTEPVIDLAAELGRSLQLSRAGALGLTRLNLAIKAGDRQAAMAAMDRLHAVDAEMERLVERLPRPPEQHPAHAEWETIARHLADQKLSLAFEKLAMVSEISGPDMVSAQPRPDLPPSRRAPARPSTAPTEANVYRITPPDAAQDQPPLAEWPRLPAVQPTEWNGIPAWLIGLLLAVLAMVAIGTAVVTMA